MDIPSEWNMLGHVALSGLFGALIGLEREKFNSVAGIRTYSIIALASCLFGLISIHLSGSGDPGRISAQIVTGVGFLGAGVILRDQGSVKGLTTAATMWATSAVGLAIAHGLFILGFACTFLISLVLALHRLSWWSEWKSKNRSRGEKNHD